ncbi:unnamed protein product [Rhizoctonia solani]|nr:unnamed protein product [Rhizoctonia solani]
MDGLKSYHIVFAVDSSSSMKSGDRQPLPNTPISDRLRLACNNRYGAVLSALYGFWKSREPGSIPSGQSTGVEPTRSDAYSIITFTTGSTICTMNDTSSTTEQLIENLISSRPRGGTSFLAALERIALILESNWNDDRIPVVIFLSDGEDSVPEQAIRTTCQMCIRLGTPLHFYTISFGTPEHSNSLQSMAEIARSIYVTRPGSLSAQDACSYANAIDSIQLARTFLGISHALKKPRAALIGSSNNRLVLVTTQWDEFKANLTREDAHDESENQTPLTADKNEGEDKRRGDEGNEELAERIEYSEPESEVEEEDKSGSDSGGDESENDESDSEEFWEEAFNLEFELGEEAFNAFCNNNMSDEEVLEYDEPNDDNDSLIGEL